MKRSLAVLGRVRSIEKRVARAEFAEAERARRHQEERVDSVVNAIDASRLAETLGAGGAQALYVAHEYDHRIRLEESLRRELGVLSRREAESAERRQVLTEADRSLRVVELAILRYDEEEALQARRADGRRLDDVAGVRWWRENR
jgi:hypothetical protein